MASKSETGHAKNVANFEKLIEFIISYDNNYKPTQKAIQIESLNALLKKAQENIGKVGDITVDFNNTTNERANQFAPLSKLCTRVVNALIAVGADAKKVEDARGYNRKLQRGSRSKPAKPKNADAPVPNTISTSQQSYDRKIEHFTGLVKTLKSEKSYQPNEEDLSIKSLEQILQSFKDSRKQLNTVQANIKKARLTRNKTLYTQKTGLYDIATDIKTYVKSVFGARAPEYKQLVKIKFSNKQS